MFGKKKQSTTPKAQVKSSTVSAPGNVIHKNDTELKIRFKRDTSGNKAGDIVKIKKGESGWSDGKYDYFISHLRNPEYVEILDRKSTQRAVNKSNPFVPKKQTQPLKMADGEKIPKGADRALIGKDSRGEGHIIMVTSNHSLIDEKKKSAPKKTEQAKPAAKRVEAPKAKSSKPAGKELRSAPPKRTVKVLRRVEKQTGGYTAWDARTGKTFATEKEAREYAADIQKKTGVEIQVTRTDRQVTHTFKSK